MKKLFKPTLFLAVLLASQAALAQYPVWDDPNSLPQWMTPEEELRKKEIGLNFVRTGEPTGPVKSIAEFEKHKGALIRYNNGLGIPYSVVAEISEQSKVYTIVANTSQQNSAITNYSNNGVNMSNCEWIFAPTDSYWTRDYGPMFITTGNNDIAVVDFPYNRPRPNDNAIPGVVANYLGMSTYGMDVIHTGGNYMSDGFGIAASTDLVYEENDFDSLYVDQEVLDFLGIQNYHVTLDPLGDYIRHVDCWAKFLDVDKILIAQVPTNNSRYSYYEQVATYYANQISSYGTPYQVFRVYEPNGQPYTNSFILNNKVYVPITNSSYDAAALAVYQNAMPGYEVYGYYSSSWASTDALHCRVHEIADAGMLRITHIPVNGSFAYQPTFQVNANIIAHSDQPLKTDSLFIIYKANQGSYDTVPLTFSQGNTYTGSIPVTVGDTLITYYLFAADQSGRRENWPLIGAPGARSFHIIPEPVPVTGVTLSPVSASIEEGQTLQLTATVLPANATNKSVTWSTSNASVATVSTTGLVTGIDPGTAIITVTTNDGGYIAASNITVTVSSTPLTASATYTLGHISTDNQFTSISSYSRCPGYLTVTIPTGAVIVGVDVSYSMTASNKGYKSDQRSQLRCTSPGGIAEPSLAVGVGNSTGTYNYNRTNLTIANNVTGGGDIQFELHAGRTYSSSGYSGCSTYNNRVNNNTWTVTVYYTVPNVPVTGVTVDPITMNLYINDTASLAETVSPANASNKNVIWASSNPLVATVDDSGLVTATGEGDATITVTTEDGGFTANSVIAVINGTGSVSATYSTGDIPTDDQFVSLPGSSACPGTLSVTIPANAFIIGVDVTYSMTASQYGYMADQRSQLKCTSTGGIAEPILTTGSGNSTGTFNYERTGLDIANGVTGGGEILFELHSGRTWSSVGYNGCQTYNNYINNNTWTVTVHYSMTGIPVAGISVNPATMNMVLNTTCQLTATVLPVNATNKQVTWTSSNTAIATVDAFGLVTATGGGNATITATTVDGGFSATCGLTVTVPVTGISVTPGISTLYINETCQLSASIMPSGASTPAYTWSSSNPEVATVSTNGLVTGVGSGLAYITATSTDGGFTDYCEVNVNSSCTAEGNITFERWDNIPGNAVIDLTKNINYPDNPTTTSTLTSFEIPYNVANNYGVKVSGYICAPLTGIYRFWIAGDDNVELWLSTDNTEANKIKIAYHTGYTRSRQWNKYSTQKSVYINLVQGQSYYVEALMKHGSGTDNMAVGWLKPGQTGTSPSQVIPGSVLSPNGPAETSLTLLELSDVVESQVFSVFPNPTSGRVTIAASIKPEGNAEITVVSPNGQIMLKERVSFDNNIELELDSVISGFCILKIEAGDYTEYKKLFIIK